MAEVGCFDPLFRVVATLDSRDEEYVCLCLSKNGDLLSGHESKFKVWSCATEYHEWILFHVVHIPEKGDVTCIIPFPNVDDKYVVSINNCVAIYALTRDRAFKPLHMFHLSGDEINQVDINPRASFICACDDSGDIKLIDVENLCVYKTLTRQHKNICSTVKFNPRKPWELFSGGLDCQLIRWDFNRGRPLFVIDVQTSHSVNNDKKTLESYMVNPPMVHCVDVLSSIHCVVCALGNGSVAVYSAFSPKQLEAICLAHLHSTSVACVCCLEIPGREPTHVVVSGGNDGNICVSILKYERPREQVKTQKKQHSQLQQSLGELNLIVTIEHGSKVNWMAVRNNSRSAESLTPGKTITLSHSLMIAVADQTSVAKVYEVKF